MTNDGNNRPTIYMVKIPFERKELAEEFQKIINNNFLLKSEISEIKGFDWSSWSKKYFKQ